MNTKRCQICWAGRSIGEFMGIPRRINDRKLYALSKTGQMQQKLQVPQGR